MRPLNTQHIRSSAPPRLLRLFTHSDGSDVSAGRKQKWKFKAAAAEVSSDLPLPDHQTGEQRAESTSVNALNESRSDTTCSSGEHLRLKPHFYHHSNSGRPVSLWLLNQRGPDHWQLSHQPQQKEVKSEKRAFLPQFFSQFQFFSVSLLFCCLNPSTPRWTEPAPCRNVSFTRLEELEWTPAVIQTSGWTSAPDLTEGEI